ncbi:MAG: PIN domain-containing protein [Candidatus Nanoarchaeia archaeon]|jgi:rRNA-processing protein FCF1|nr:PIN domain-containing protein [Candidatus Nanoarchaeia archaeon]|tara:strand:+ start:3216 stop:3593 length:378 start_codon:yes stop_codon:yes gene_type:complete
MQIVIDTNSLIYAAKEKVDVITELKKMGFTKIIIPNEVLKELEFIQTDKKQKGADKNAAKLAIQIIKFSKVDTIHLGKGHPDDKILEFAVAKNFSVLTNDKILKKRLKAESVQIFTISKKLIRNV